MTLGINTQQVGPVRPESRDHRRTSYKRKTDTHIFRSKLSPGKKKKKEIKDIEILFESERPSLLANIRRFCLCRRFSLKPFKIYSFF